MRDRALIEIEPGEARAASSRRVFIRDMIVPAEIGAFRHERGVLQRVRINIELNVDEHDRPVEDDLRNVVDYDEIVRGVRGLLRGGHVNLVETLAERVATLCFADWRVTSAKVRVEKLDVYDDVDAVGVEIERRRQG
jgi:7,8-dihydroneopterin aldolase/epimerase/oxygenase